MLVGAAGDDVKLEVPPGVIARLDDGRVLGKQTSDITSEDATCERAVVLCLGELNVEGDEVVLARGTAGAGPRNGFTQTKSQSINVTLDLKLIADIGLVGWVCITTPV